METFGFYRNAWTKKKSPLLVKKKVLYHQENARVFMAKIVELKLELLQIWNPVTF